MRSWLSTGCDLWHHVSVSKLTSFNATTNDCQESSILVFLYIFYSSVGSRINKTQPGQSTVMILMDFFFKIVTLLWAKTGSILRCIGSPQLSGWLWVCMGSASAIRNSCTAEKFSRRKEGTVCVLAWERRMERLWRNPRAKKMISLLTLNTSLFEQISPVVSTIVNY